MGSAYDFIANTSDGVFGVDPQQTIVLWNDAATSILGYRPDEVLGRNCYEIVEGRDSEGCAVCVPGCDAIESASRLDLPPSQDLAVQKKGGDTVWLNVSTIILPSPTQKLSVLIHLFREVSQQHELVQVVREFASVVSGISRGTGKGRKRKVPNGDDCVRLTRREREIMGHLVTGVTTEMIAEQLSISSRTVRNHVNNILGKLGVHSRLEAVTYSIKNGLV